MFPEQLAIGQTGGFQEITIRTIVRDDEAIVDAFWWNDKDSPPARIERYNKYVVVKGLDFSKLADGSKVDTMNMQLQVTGVRKDGYTRQFVIEPVREAK